MSVVKYGAAEAVVARGPSPKIWADCPVLQFMADPALGMYVFDDFKNSLVISRSDESDTTDFVGGIGRMDGDMNWYVYADTDKLVDVALQADDDGVLMLDSDGTDDDNTSIIWGDNVTLQINSPKKGERKKFWFEVRYKVNTVTNTDLPHFIGFTEAGQSASLLVIKAAGVLATKDYFGFHVDEADGNDLNIVYLEASSGTAQAITGKIAPVADTWIRVGMRLDVDSDKIRCYADGVDLGDDAAIDISSINFPNDTDMTIHICIHSGAAGENSDNMKIDWVRFAQEY